MVIQVNWAGVRRFGERQICLELFRLISQNATLEDAFSQYQPMTPTAGDGLVVLTRSSADVPFMTLTRVNELANILAFSHRGLTYGSTYLNVAKPVLSVELDLMYSQGMHTNV